jgi:deoxyribonuclease V
MAVQTRLAGRVCQAKPATPIRFVAGLDAAFAANERLCFSAVVLWDLRERRVVEQHTAQGPLRFPYVPGLLSFREVPVLLAALRQLKQTPEALMCDGQGLAHPRRFGLACHLGVLCGWPALGCAKSILIGTHGELALQRGAVTPLRAGQEILGMVVRTRTGVKPVYVSVGHLLDLATAVQLTLDCATQFRLPEPTRLADRLVAQAKSDGVQALPGSGAISGAP